MRKFLFTLHSYMALAAGVFVVILGVTGGIMAFETELDHVIHWKLSYVTPQGHALSLAEIGTAVSKAFPGERIGGYALSTSPNLSYQVSLRRGAVCVNQYTGEVLGVRPGGMDFLAYVHQLHLRLLTPLFLPDRDRHEVGKQIMSWAGVAILFSAALRSVSVVAAETRWRPMGRAVEAGPVPPSQHRGDLFAGVSSGAGHPPPGDRLFTDHPTPVSPGDPRATLPS